MLSGISSDHECVEEAEALEKLRRGMWMMLRYGSSTPDLGRMVSIVKENPILSARCMAVSDDLSAKEIVNKGHMDEKVRVMVRAGLNPLVALRMVTLSPASYFELKDRGAIGPGLRADMVLVDNLEGCRVDKVWKNGVLVADEGKLLRRSPPDVTLLHSNSAKVAPLTQEQIRVYVPEDSAELCVIGVEEGSITTRTLWMPPSVKDGLVVADAKRDVAKIVVQERHKGTGRSAVGFVSGMGMTQGAIASSVAHDAHNFVAVGMDDHSIITALTHLGQNGGGLVVTAGSEVLGYFALPVAGLMTTLDAFSTAQALDEMEERAAAFGVGIASPFMTLSFLSLTVIPELKITDKGYVDISKGGSWPLFSNA
jgi:adenine deaminase